MHFFGFTTLLLFGITERIQVPGLVLGLISIAVGYGLLKAHREGYQQALTPHSSQADQNFESRKLKRRSLIALLMASIGCMLVALFWVTEARALAIFVLMIVSQLFLMMAIAIVDMFSIGLRMATRPGQGPSDAEIQEIIRRHRQNGHQHQNESES